MATRSGNGRRSVRVPAVRSDDDHAHITRPSSGRRMGDRVPPLLQRHAPRDLQHNLTSLNPVESLQTDKTRNVVGVCVGGLHCHGVVLTTD